VEYFMGDSRKGNETGITRNLHVYVQQQLRAANKAYKCSKRVLQNDIELFVKKGARLDPRFRRGHKRILRYTNLEWKNPLLANMPKTSPSPDALPTLRDLAQQQGKTELVLRLGPTLVNQYEDLTDKNGILTLHVTLSQPVRRLIFGYGKELEVLKPERLRVEIRQIVNELFKLYRKDKDPKNKKNEQLDMFSDFFN